MIFGRSLFLVEKDNEKKETNIHIFYGLDFHYHFYIHSIYE